MMNLATNSSCRSISPRSASDQVASFYLLGLDAEIAKTAANALMTGAGLIGAGLALYGLYGWWKSRQTEEGDVPA